jgi:flavin reductase (DIM6/NTAB) family NADH-FMN oxidoreductase RutF
MITKDINQIPFSELYLLLNSAIAPRPIAFISTIDKNGNANLSPFNYFNIFSVDPPILIVSIFPKKAIESKDTLSNIVENSETVISIVSQ